MTVLICDRCGDITADLARCWCGATVDEPVDLDAWRRERSGLVPSEDDIA